VIARRTIRSEVVRDKRYGGVVEQLLTPQQMAGKLGVAVSTIYQWTHTGFIPHVKLGRLVRFRESDVEKWLNNRVQKGRSTYRLPIDDLVGNNAGRRRKRS
jgi:excisionase family DNA binding protein